MNTTTVSLTKEQRIALMELRIKRMVRGEKESSMKAMLLEGLELLLRKEGIPDWRLDFIFRAPRPRAKVVQITRRRSGNKT